jgi:hypothetical protein
VLLDGIPLNDPFGGWIPWTRLPTAFLSKASLSPDGSPEALGVGVPGGAIRLESRFLSDPPFTFVESVSGNRMPYQLTLATAQDSGGGGTRLFLGGSLLDFSGYPTVRESMRGSVDESAFVRSQSL